MVRVWVGLVVALGGCLHDDLVDCGNGITCPAGTACAAIADASYCVPPDDISACAGRDPFATCTLASGETGACYAATPASVCLPAGCGNGLLDPGEACDDGNGVVGDGCSGNCLSDETCGNGVVDPLHLEQCDDGNRIGRDGCASDCTRETLQWDPVLHGDPTPAYWQAAAYDAARARVVLFGGRFQTTLGITVARGDTYEWDGAGWRKAAPAISPSPRWGHVLAYDPGRRRTVLFGGASPGAEALDETWEWDGDSWQLRAPATSPSARAGAMAAYDPESHRVLLFGGRDATGAVLGDLWAWDGTTWTQVPGPGPSARAYGAMTYDPVRGVMVVAGGDTPNGDLPETSERRGGQWMAIVKSPAAMTHVGMAFDGVGIVVFGGFMPGRSTDTTYRWDGQTWSLLPVQGPSPRELAAIVRDPRHGVMLVGGHWSTSCLGCAPTRDDVWLWDAAIGKWTQITSIAPPGRATHGAAFDALRGTLVVFGGGPSGTQVEDPPTTWELTGDHWSAAPTTAPGGRNSPAMAYDAARGETVMFGGAASPTGLLDETWLWNGKGWRLATPSMRPAARYEAALAYDPVRKRTVLFGGRTLIALADTWEWDGVTWTPKPVTVGPPPRSRAVMSFDPVRRRIVLATGENGVGALGDAWEWDGTSWTMISASPTPPVRGASAACWNGARGATVMFAGTVQTFSQLDDAWELSGGVWRQQLSAARPAPRHFHTMTPAADGVSVLAYGGLLNNNQGATELWRLRWTNASPHELCSVNADNDGDGLAGCADPDCWARCTPLCPPGATCDPSWPRCGDGVCNAALEDCHLCPGDCTCTPICGDTFCDPGETCPGDC